MWRSPAFYLVAAFWILMNVLLWRSEFQGAHNLGNSIPVGVVWQKILTAPDDSALEIMRSGKKMGFCRWIPNIGEEVATGKASTEELEGMVRRLSGYSLNVEGNFLLPENHGRFRFDFKGQFSTNKTWKDLKLKTILRPAEWEIHASSADQTVEIRILDGDSDWRHTFAIQDLQNPQKLLGDLGMDGFAGMLSSFGFSGTNSNRSLGLQWNAQHDFLKIGHSDVRVYRVQASLLDRYRVVLWISLVGEIMRVELPYQIVLLNDALINI
jgi:hypothetical protein